MVSDLQSDFIKFIAGCVSKLHDEVLNRMFFSWNCLTKPTSNEEEWYKETHGPAKWRDIEVTHSYNRKRIKDVSKELRKRKIDKNKTDPRTIDILRKPFQKDGVYSSYKDEDLAKERLQEFDCQILTNVQVLGPIFEKLVKDKKYSYYTRILIDMYFPKFLQQYYLKNKSIDKKSKKYLNLLLSNFMDETVE